MCCSYAVPPTRSGFLDFGPDPDFFDQTDPDVVRNLVKKSVFFQKYAKITHKIGFFWHLLKESVDGNFTFKVLECLDFSTWSGFLKKMVGIWSGMLKKLVRI